MAKNRNRKNTERIYVTYTKQQIDLIDEFVRIGQLGANRPEVLKQIFMAYLKEKGKI